MKDQSKAWQLKTGMGNIQLLQASFYRQNFARHSHDDFPLGVIEKGALSFYFRRQNLVAPEGTVNLSYPGEVHDGHSNDRSGWHYRMFYFDLEFLETVFREMHGKSSNLPFFPNGVINDTALANLLKELHQSIEHGMLTQLETEWFLVNILAYMIFRHSDQKCWVKPVARRHPGVDRVIDFIGDSYQKDVGLRELADMAGLSPYHFCRLFEKQTGITPYSHLIQTRVKEARRRLSTQQPIADIALDVGFADQSHLTRRFRQVFGITPNKYRNMVQD